MPLNLDVKKKGGLSWCRDLSKSSQITQRSRNETQEAVVQGVQAKIDGPDQAPAVSVSVRSYWFCSMLRNTAFPSSDNSGFPNASIVLVKNLGFQSVFCFCLCEAFSL